MSLALIRLYASAFGCLWPTQPLSVLYALALRVLLGYPVSSSMSASVSFPLLLQYVTVYVTVTVTVTLRYVYVTVTVTVRFLNPLSGK